VGIEGEKQRGSDNNLPAVQLFNGSIVQRKTSKSLLVKDSGGQVIAQRMQLIAGRTAQEYNQRKKRTGVFWDDRFEQRRGPGVIFAIFGNGVIGNGVRLSILANLHGGASPLLADDNLPFYNFDRVNHAVVV
jgi:hypothetical protein